MARVARVDRFLKGKYRVTVFFCHSYAPFLCPSLFLSLSFFPSFHRPATEYRSIPLEIASILLRFRAVPFVPPLLPVFVDPPLFFPFLGNRVICPCKIRMETYSGRSRGRVHARSQGE